MGRRKMFEACRIGEIVSGFVETLAPLQSQYDSVAQAWDSLLPVGLRAHCRIAGVTNGCLKVAAEGSSYMYELQLCKPLLLRELQRLCPAARISRIEVGMLR